MGNRGSLSSLSESSPRTDRERVTAPPHRRVSRVVRAGYSMNMPRGSRRPRDRGLYVEIHIDAPMERVWELTQDPHLHARWDARFSKITPTAVRENGAQEFGYELDLGVHTIRGTGVSLGEKRTESGQRTSALLFTTEDPLSPLGDGRGYWRYVPSGNGVRFFTGYDYEPGWGALGRLLDPILTRRLVWWLTAWSFDRLRLWAEQGIEPERVGWWRGWLGGPRASARNCASRPLPQATPPNPGDGVSRSHWSAHPTRIMDDAPHILTELGDVGTILPRQRRTRRRGTHD